MTAPTISPRRRVATVADTAGRVPGGGSPSRWYSEVVDLLLADSPLAEALPRDLIAQVAASAFFGLAVMDLVGANIDIDGMTALVNTLLEFLRGETD
jgi:hypothetical protein